MVTTAVEHSSVLDAIARTTDDVTVVGVDGQGRFDPDAVADAVRPDTVLVSVQLANHEVGTLQPAAEIVELVRDARGDAVVHVDACAAAGHVAGRLRRPRCRPLLDHRPHVRRPEGRVGAAGAPRAALPAVRGRRRAGTRPAGRHRERPRDRRASAPRATRSPGRRGEAARARAVRAARRRRGAPDRRHRALRRSGRRASPTSCASASTASRPSRSCSRSTSVASPCTPDRRARASRSNRRRCSRRWASTPTARCGPAWVGRRPTPTSTRSSTPCPSSSDCCDELALRR